MHHPTPAAPSPLRRRAARRGFRGWLRCVTASTTAAAVVLLAAPVVLTGQQQAHPAPTTPPAAEPAAEPAAGPDATAVDGSDLRLVGHNKPHPHRTIKRYRVRPGDTPSGIAVRFHAWTAQLLRINHTTTLYAGEVILVPVVTRAARECTKHRHHRTNVGKHSAKKRGTAKHGTAKAGTKKTAKKAKKKAGHKKAGHKKSAHHAKKAKPKKKSRAPHRVRHAHGWHHRGYSHREVRRVVVRKAKRHGVNPALALAVSWQEAGWQHGRVSPAGAIGAMQIMPGTGRWMSSMVGRRLNIRDLYDNVTAGVVLLRLLRDQAGPRVAVAGYYQGLAGVRRYGMYPSTKRYVANVHALRKRIEKGWSPV